MRFSLIFKTMALSICCLGLIPKKSLAWGYEGHAIVADIAMHYLPKAKQEKILALLNQDKSLLVPKNIAGEASFPDAYWLLHPETINWHFINNDWRHPDMKAACSKIESPEKGGCVLNRIETFRKALNRKKTSPEERLFAMQFILHLVGDMHQPLHAISDNDRGGTQKFAVVPGNLVPTNFAWSLHAYWDTNFIELEGLNQKALEKKLISEISKKDIKEWRKGSVWDWSQEAHELGAKDGYAALPKPRQDGLYVLDENYTHKAQEDINLQLKKAGVRLAMILDEAVLPEVKR
ncbi:hypothetical protein FAI41_02050 [Acetobacteraceae bacterium]|nr:hypothetical protein FAI41_02050 [Acetobacteraceae bacterium]